LSESSEVLEQLANTRHGWSDTDESGDTWHGTCFTLWMGHYYNPPAHQNLWSCTIDCVGQSK
jgi:hypothetical protein